MSAGRHRGARRPLLAGFALAAAVAAACLLWPAPSFATLNFTPTLDYPAHAGETTPGGALVGSPDVEVGDLNGDARADLVVATPFAQTVSVLLGRGDGSFAAPVGYHSPMNPEMGVSLVLGDLNGDGHLDVVAAGRSGGIWVLLGRGDGTLAAPLAYGIWASSIALGDLNGDGRLDLTAANPEEGIWVLLGRGDGTFAAPVNYPTRGEPGTIALGDLNADGRLDLTVPDIDVNHVSVQLGRGDGSFAAPVNYRTRGQPETVALGDLNGDGRLDLAVANVDSNEVTVLLGRGDGSFAARAREYRLPLAPGFVSIGDLNGDQRADLLAAGEPNLPGLGQLRASARVSVLLGRRDGTLARAVGFRSHHGALATADVNADGHVDLVAANEDSVSILLQKIGVTRPRISASVIGAPACPRKAVRVRIRVEFDTAAERLIVVRLDRTTIRRTRGARMLLRIPIRRLKPGTHRLRIAVSDDAGGRANKVVRFRRCAAG